jgi:hypothetical protein
MRDVPLSFLSAAKHRKARMDARIEQLQLYDEPDHRHLLADREAFRRQRGPAAPDAFGKEVERQRLAIEPRSGSHLPQFGHE